MKISKRALTFIEILIATTILAIALIPVLVLTSETGRQTMAMEKHQLAANIAAGIMDRYLAMPFKICANKIISADFPAEIMGNENFAQLLDNSQAVKTLEKAANGFTYEVKLIEPANLAEFGRVFKIIVTVNWPETPGKTPTRSLSLEALKFDENP